MWLIDKPEKIGDVTIAYGKSDISMRPGITEEQERFKG
jgi:hypothetical protein